jgi:hypothetical protein
MQAAHGSSVERSMLFIVLCVRGCEQGGAERDGGPERLQA